MLHSQRVWCVTPAATAVELARRLTEGSWTVCTAFEFAGYLFLNDSTSGGALQEYALVKRPTTPGGPFLQVESITMSWCTFEQGLNYIEMAVGGHYDHAAFFGEVSPRLETAAEHRTKWCGHCA